MHIREERQGDVGIVSIDNHLDTPAAPDFEQKLTQMVDEGVRRLVVDCGALVYVNSAGLKVFLLAAKRLDALGGRLVISTLGPSVMTIFKTIGFDRIMKIVATRDEALRALGTPAEA